MIKKVQLYINNTKRNASNIAKELKQKLPQYGYIITDSDPDLVIGFGGDGTLLNWLSDNNYNTKVKYIGINCGTLGFMQDFNSYNMDEFIRNIPTYVEEKLNFIKLEIVKPNSYSSSNSCFYALNEFCIKSNIDKAFRTSVEISGEFLEDFVGEKLLFSTPTGSTAQNRSAHGSILFPSLNIIQMTPSDNAINSCMRSLTSSICIPSNLSISLSPSNHDEIKIISDGKIVYTGLYDKIIISNSDLYMTKLTDKKNSFVSKIREKLI